MTHYELKRLSAEDGMDVYEMLQEMPADENGFMNGCQGMGVEEYKSWLISNEQASRGIGLEDWQVEQSIYWLYIEGEPVGFGKLRHRLTEKLREEGGHAGYSIRPSQRGKGYGKLLLKGLMQEANALGIDRILLTVNKNNEASKKLALSNGGVIEASSDVRYYIWVDCAPDAEA